MDYILNVITFILLFPNNEIKAIPYHFDPKQYTCLEFYMSKIEHVEEKNIHLFKDFNFDVKSIGSICSDVDIWKE